MKSNIKITLDSENRENNQVIINGIDITKGVTKISVDWSTKSAPKISVDFG